jgi:hypothetical protein
MSRPVVFLQVLWALRVWLVPQVRYLHSKAQFMFSTLQAMAMRLEQLDKAACKK